VLGKLRSIASISLAGALVGLAANYGERGAGSSNERLGGSSLKESIRAVAYTGAEDALTESGKADDAEKSVPTYAGRQVCGECHQENFELHSKHGHASTFFNIASTDIPKIFDGKTFDAGEGYGVYSYQKDDRGNLIAKLPKESKPESIPLQYVLGSGHNAQTFLTLYAAVNGKTEGIEHRVSCYFGHRLGITVGHERKSPTNDLEMFGASHHGETLERCVYCHTTSSKVENGTVLDLIPNVDCEKCHGPGSEHVRLARGNPNPPPYSVGGKYWDRESEIQLCGDCHRLPRSITKQELRDYPDSLVRFQPVGMLRSQCYLESDQSLRCTTCHNPHATNHGNAEKDQVENCIKCHDQTEKSHVVCPVSPKTECIGCHMPAIDQKQGIKFHDHWIRVRDR
jgi:predicted CXXCH cytochrome family protein